MDSPCQEPLSWQDSTLDFNTVKRIYKGDVSKIRLVLRYSPYIGLTEILCHSEGSTQSPHSFIKSMSKGMASA